MINALLNKYIKELHGIYELMQFNNWIELYKFKIKMNTLF